MSKLPSFNHSKIGLIGEDLVTQWLKSNGWQILHRRFSCPWGEVDIIAEHDNKTLRPTSVNCKTSILAFVEVKTRSAGNWDAGGKDSVTINKQRKILIAAEMFLANHPDKADYSCRFDVASVFYKKSTPKKQVIQPKALATLSAQEYEFILLDYIESAFDISARLSSI
jgi:putative endonuclease